MLDSLVTAVQDSVDTETITVRDKEYVTRQVYLPPDEKQVAALTVLSLTGLINYLNQSVDAHNPKELLIHIEDARTVKVYEQVESKEGNRHLWLQADAKLTPFRFGSHFTQEDFITAFQSLFVHGEGDYETVLNYVSNVSASDEVQNSDSGVTQEIVLKSGIRKNEIEIKNPVELAPIRTFTEIEQPVSPFILRMRKQGDIVTTALFEADNGKWENAAREAIQDYIIDKLSAEIVGDISILA